MPLQIGNQEPLVESGRAQRPKKPGSLVVLWGLDFMLLDCPLE